MAEYVTYIAIYVAVGFICASYVSYSDPGIKDPKTIMVAWVSFIMWPIFLPLFLAVGLGQWIAKRRKKV